MRLKTIIVEDEPLGLEAFDEECHSCEEIDLIGKFTNAEDALFFADGHEIQFALLDICLPGMGGVELGRRLKEQNPQTIIIYLTGFQKYVVDAVKAKADYCLMKPCNKEDIMDAFLRAKLLSGRFAKRMKVQTFGRFEVYVDGKPIHFCNEKARELFAYCVGREGARVTMDEAVGILWPTRPYDEKVKRLYRKAIAAIVSCMEQCEIREAFGVNRGSCYINREAMDCDLFRYHRGEDTEFYETMLERSGYMQEYEWAGEVTIRNPETLSPGIL